MLAAVLALVMTAESAEAQAVAPVRPTEVGAAAGVLSSSYAYGGGRTGEAFVALNLDARYLVSLFTVEGTVVGEIPTLGNAPQGSLGVTLRVGVSTSRFLVTVGAMAQYTPSPAPIQWLPSLSAAVRIGPTLASLGVFDEYALVPARLSVEWHDLGVGWVFPLGGELFGRYRLTPGIQVQAHALAFWLFNSFNAMGTVGVVWEPGR